MQFLQQLHDMKVQLKMSQQLLHESEVQATNLENLMGPARMKAHSMIKQRIKSWRLRKRLKMLSSQIQLKNKISSMKESEISCVLQEVLQEEQNRFVDDLKWLVASVLQPIGKFITEEVHDKHDLDPLGWKLQELQIFTKATSELCSVHVEGLPRLRSAIEAGGLPLQAVSEFYLSVADQSVGSMILFMNRMQIMIKLIGMKDFQSIVSTAEQSGIKKKSVQFVVFGVLQASTTMSALLDRLSKLCAGHGAAAR